MFKPYIYPSLKSNPRQGAPRFSDLINQQAPDGCDFVVYGYPDDRGVINNGGREGAKHGPDAIRDIFYRSTSSPRKTIPPKICDLGNLSLSDSIKLDHEKAISSLIEACELEKQRLISFGGGHDFSYPDGKVFLSQEHKTKPVILNIDAHLDCRPVEGEINSGTPFYRLLEEHPGEFHFFEIGLQEQCNSKTHLDWATDRGLRVMWLEDILVSEKPFKDQLISFLGDSLNQNTKAYISVDMDAFASSIAPGCSQSWPTGISSEMFFKSLSLFMEAWDVRQLGIYETCPRLDIDNRTTRLASKIAHFFISNPILNT